MIEIAKLTSTSVVKLYNNHNRYMVNCRIEQGMKFIGLINEQDATDRKAVTVEEIECLLD